MNCTKFLKLCIPAVLVLLARLFLSFSASAQSSGELMQMAVAAASLGQTVNRLTDRLEDPFVTVNTVSGDAGIKKAQDEYNQLIRNKTPKSRRS